MKLTIMLCAGLIIQAQSVSVIELTATETGRLLMLSNSEKDARQELETLQKHYNAIVRQLRDTTLEIKEAHGIKETGTFNRWMLDKECKYLVEQSR